MKEKIPIGGDAGGELSSEVPLLVELLLLLTLLVLENELFTFILARLIMSELRSLVG